MSGISTDETNSNTIVKSLIDEGNSDAKFLRIYLLDEDGSVESFEDINYDNSQYVATGPVKLDVGAASFVGPEGPQGDTGQSGFGIYAFSNTDATGTILKARGLTLVKGATGFYDYSFTTPTPDANYAISAQIFNLPTNTDTNVFVNNKTINGFQLSIGQGDNGTTLDSVMDEDHSVVVLGDAGPQGITSAYESWLNIGNVGTEADFIVSLVSTVPGPQGPQGPPGDSQIRISPNDSTVGFIEDKFLSANNQIVITTLNDGGDEDLQFELQPSNIGTSELNNDANFIDSAGAPVQPADIADFETSIQLDVRDVNNRNRTNHTGTQTVATISDFTTGVAANETTTSLSFNSGTNILSYTDEDGVITNLDLSLFLDDTNLAQIVSGTLNPATGITTFTRDNLTTFDVDFSSLNDQAFINTAIATHETTINNHDDVDVTTNSPVVGSKLLWDGSNWVPFLDFKDFVSTNTSAGTQGTALVQYLRLSTNIPVTGNYKISWNYEWSLNNTGSDFEAIVELDDTTTLATHVEEPQDSGGTGIVVTNLDGGTFNTGTNQRREKGGFTIVNLTAGGHTVDIDLANSINGTEATIYRACITIERWE